MLIDLRDGFGEGLSVRPKLKTKMPIALLSNHGTREGAMALVKSLKEDAGAKVFGETTASDQAAQSKENLSRIDWTVLIVGVSNFVLGQLAVGDLHLNLLIFTAEDGLKLELFASSVEVNEFKGKAILKVPGHKRARLALTCTEL